jgi:hypothetical protein
MTAANMDIVINMLAAYCIIDIHVTEDTKQKYLAFLDHMCNYYLLPLLSYIKTFADTLHINEKYYSLVSEKILSLIHVKLSYLLSKFRYKIAILLQRSKNREIDVISSHSPPQPIIEAMTDVIFNDKPTDVSKLSKYAEDFGYVIEYENRKASVSLTIDEMDAIIPIIYNTIPEVAAKDIGDLTDINIYKPQVPSQKIFALKYLSYACLMTGTHVFSGTAFNVINYITDIPRDGGFSAKYNIALEYADSNIVGWLLRQNVGDLNYSEELLLASNKVSVPKEKHNILTVFPTDKERSKNNIEDAYISLLLMRIAKYKTNFPANLDIQKLQLITTIDPAKRWHRENFDQVKFMMRKLCNKNIYDVNEIFQESTNKQIKFLAKFDRGTYLHYKDKVSFHDVCEQYIYMSEETNSNLDSNTIEFNGRNTFQILEYINIFDILDAWKISQQP